MKKILFISAFALGLFGFLSLVWSNSEHESARRLEIIGEKVDSSVNYTKANVYADSVLRHMDSLGLQYKP
jgi:hypothetical protein